MLSIEARIRKVYGKGASRRLRGANRCPGIVYGGKVDSVPIELEHNALWNLQKKAEFYTGILLIRIDDQEEIVKVQAIQRHVFKPKLTHIDFLRVLYGVER